MIVVVILFSLALTSQGSCGPHCFTCNSQTSKCQKCIPGSYIDSSFSCNLCQNHCVNCYGPKSCTHCEIGYALLHGQCYTCPQFCLSCNAFQKNAAEISSSCNQCMQGYYQSTFGLCIPCMPACSSCSNKTICIKCGYGLSFDATNNACVQCPPHCLSCRGSHCTECEKRYYASKLGVCLECPENCLRCQGNTCYQCDGSSFLSEAKECEKCSENCLRCSSANDCYECQSETFPIGNNTCQACFQNCVLCENQLTCEACQIGYYLFSNTTCLRCKSQCLMCHDSESCYQCQGSFYLQNGKCTPCLDNCAFCLEEKDCQLCSSVEFTVINGVCTQCKEVWENCLTCSNSCLSCQDGYYLQDHLCLQDDNSLGALWIALIVFGSVLLAIVLGSVIWYCWKNRQGYGSGNNENTGTRASYYEMP